MTEPGAVERVPLKVVPYFVQEPEDEPVIPEEPAPEVVPRRRTPLIGIASLALAVVTGVLTSLGVVVASGGDFGAGTLLAFGAVGASILAVVGGVVGIVGRFGRRWAIAGVVLGVVANPLVLLYGLQFVNGLRVGA